MVHETLAATNAVVTLDVGIPDIFWGWYVTMNMWAKSIGTGLVFMLFLLLKKNSSEMNGLRTPVMITSFVFMNIFLIFTWLDLHQMWRMWHIFFYPHWTSAITVGAWMRLTGQSDRRYQSFFIQFIARLMFQYQRYCTHHGVYHIYFNIIYAL